MDQPLDELYFVWLYRQVGSTRLKNPSRTYWSLCRQLFQKEFVWFVPNDDNRVEDGRDLRLEFLREEHIDEVDLMWQQLGCSFLEMMIALSRRLAFEEEGQPSRWFWHLITNLGIEVTDADYNIEIEEAVDNRLNTVIFRTYDYSGLGGLFPLEYPQQDQRDVEIWYQLQAYLLEKEAARGG